MAKKKLSGLNFEAAKKPKLINELTSQSLTEKEKIKSQLQLHPDLKKYMPPHSEEQFLTLERSILDDKRVREKIQVWEFEETYYILDGYTRYSIIQKHKHLDLPWDIELVKGIEDLKAAKQLMRQIQLGRRNLYKNQISYLRGTTYLDEKQDKGGDRKSEKSNPQNGELTGSTVERLAAEFNVGKNTIERDAQFARGVDRFNDEKLPEEIQEERDRILLGDTILLKKEVEFLGKQPAVDVLLYMSYKAKGGKLEDLLSSPADKWDEFMKRDVRLQPATEEPEPQEEEKPKAPKPTSAAPASDRFFKWWDGEHRQVQKIAKKGDDETKAKKKAELQERMQHLQQLLNYFE